MRGWASWVPGAYLAYSSKQCRAQSSLVKPVSITAYRAGKLGEGGGKAVTPEQMEISRLRAELARTKMEVEILKKAAAYFAKESL